MSLIETIQQRSLAKVAIDAGGSIHPLIMPADQTNGTGLMNPSIFIDGDQILCVVRHVNYTLYHSEQKKFQHQWGPLQYLHPENDIKLRTWNFLCVLNPDLSVKKIHKVDTSKLDVTPIWDFVGLEDARLFRWNGILYMSGVRRDTTTNGQGRMELSEIELTDDYAREISRVRMPAPRADDSYCEKNWMPIIDQPYTYVKWSNPTEVVQYNLNDKTTTAIYLDDGSNFVWNLPDLRGSSHVLPYKDYYFALIHTVDLQRTNLGQKDGSYQHRFVVWDRNWKIIKVTEQFSFMRADIEFCCGAAFYGDDLLLSFGFQDNVAFILRMPKTLLSEMLGL